MKRIIVSISGTNAVFDFDWATHTWTYDNDNRNLIIEEGFNTVLIVPIERLNYLRVVDIPEEEEPDETH